MAIAAPRRRADSDEHRVGVPDAFGDVRGEFEPAAVDV